jgi:hypothetical protein
MLDQLLCREVLDAISTDNKNPSLAGVLEPSPGLEPVTASLPFSSEKGGKARKGKRGHESPARNRNQA